MTDDRAITPLFVKTMSRYNAWQNKNIYECAARLNEDERRADRGAFFRSIHATLNHILWADQMWLMRFGAAEQPAARSITDGLDQFPQWDSLQRERSRFDGIIEVWADSVGASDLSGDLVWYSAAAGREMKTPRQLAVMHLFNHQTHHRGQVHAMLTGYGLKPGVTDLPFGPPL